jgi:tetratricopeptide (TPR) repeat protein
MSMISSGPVPKAITSLPGVQEGIKAGAIKQVAIQQASLEPSDKAAKKIVADHVSEARKREFAADLQQNAGLVSALSHLNIKPTPAGLDRIAAAAIQNKAAFTNLVAAANLTALTLGKSAGAMQNVSQALADFNQAGNVRATDQADMAYLMARITLLVQKTEREQAMQALEEALRNAKETLESLQKERDQLDDGGKGGKVDFGGKMVTTDSLQRQARKGGVKGARAQNRIERIEARKSTLDARIDSLRDTIKILQQQLANQQIAASQDQLNEVILMLVEKAMSQAQTKTAGGNPGGQTPNATA